MLKFSHRQNRRRRRSLHVCLPKSWINRAKPWIRMRTACWHLGPLAAFQRHPLTRRYWKRHAHTKAIQTSFKRENASQRGGRPCTCSFSSLLSSTSLLSIFIYSLFLFRSFSLLGRLFTIQFLYPQDFLLSLLSQTVKRTQNGAVCYALQYYNSGSIKSPRSLYLLRVVIFKSLL